MGDSPAVVGTSGTILPHPWPRWEVWAALEGSTTQRSLSCHPLPSHPSKASGPQEPRGWGQLATGHSLEVPLLAQLGSFPPQLQPEGEGAVHGAGDQQGPVQVAVDPGGHAHHGGAWRQGPAFRSAPWTLTNTEPRREPEGEDPTPGPTVRGPPRAGGFTSPRFHLCTVGLSHGADLLVPS